MILDKRLGPIISGFIIENDPRYKLLSKHFDYKVLAYLIKDEDFINWVYDFLRIVDDSYLKEFQLSDYSLYVQPICKAFEKYLFSTLSLIGYIPIIPEVTPKQLNKYLHDNKGENKMMFEEYLYSHFNKQKSNIVESGQKNQKFRKQLLDHLIILATMYHEYRNLYMHADVKKAKSIEEIRNMGGAIIKEINDFTLVVADSGINTMITGIVNSE